LKAQEPTHGASLPVRMMKVARDMIRQPLYWLLVAVPTAAAFESIHVGDMWVFFASGLAIIPLAGLMGRATENLAETMGAGIGGLLNATFGNAAELIIALIALAKGPQMYPLVKASLTGSIIGNILLVLGLSVLLGGLKYRQQIFNRTAASMGATMLALASAGLILPAVYSYLVPSDGAGNSAEVVFLSEEIAVVLAVTYALSLVFSLRTHRHLFAGHEDELPTTGEHDEPEWDRATAITILLVSTAGVAWMSELLVGSVEHAAHQLGMTDIFVGVIVVAIVGNAAEHSTAVLVAVKNKMDLSVNIAVGSGIQIALFVAPVLVFASMILNPDQPLDLHFTPMETAAVVISIVALSMVCQDGESHWMEGVLLLALYLILGLAFYHLPPESALAPHTA
jgi:Ca2+:H+ antiporter